MTLVFPSPIPPAEISYLGLVRHCHCQDSQSHPIGFISSYFYLTGTILWFLLWLAVLCSPVVLLLWTRRKERKQRKQRERAS